MIHDSTGDLRFAVDRLVMSGRRVFGWGWAAERTRAIKAVNLRLEGDAWQSRLHGGFGLSRQDVEESHPDFVNARTSGFVLTGFAPAEPARRMWLELELADGTRREIDVTSGAENLDGGAGRLRRLRWISRAVWRRLKRGDLMGIVRRARAQNYMATSLDDAEALDHLITEVREAGGACVLLDNNMGGGSNHYRRAVIAERLERGQAVLLCTYNLPILEYRLHFFRPGQAEKVFGVSSFLALERILREAPVPEVFVNSPVSFDEPLVLAEWLARVPVEHPATRLTLTAHDYFAVCPSFVLLDADGKYCGVPDISQCRACLARHEASYVALSPPSDIGPWRALWGRALGAAHEVRCYSNATRELLLRAYPALDRARLTVIPHKVDFVPPRRPRMDHAAPLVIGIVGEITYQKGAAIVQDLVDILDREGHGARVVVIGALDVAHKSPRLTVTGPYKREDLVDIIESHGVNMLFFPSIWPETFSYVVAELALLEAPIVAFDLGAPAERLRSYPLARLCREVSAASALDTLTAFHRDLYPAPREAAE
jgi:glycosyltransferase involved in cell wall biosynthesis